MVTGSAVLCGCGCGEYAVEAGQVYGGEKVGKGERGKGENGWLSPQIGRKTGGPIRSCQKFQKHWLKPNLTSLPLWNSSI